METLEKINELENKIKELNVILEAEKQDKLIMERVKTFEDALNILGNKHPFVKQWQDYMSMESSVDMPTKYNADLIAYYKLRIITAALNKDWKQRFTKDDAKYTWFCLFTKEEYNNLSNEEKQRVILVYENTQKYTFHGFVFAGPCSPKSKSYTYFGARLAYKTSRLAKYSATQFADIWADFYLIRK